MHLSRRVRASLMRNYSTGIVEKGGILKWMSSSCEKSHNFHKLLSTRAHSPCKWIGRSSRYFSGFSFVAYFFFNSTHPSHRPLPSIFLSTSHPSYHGSIPISFFASQLFPHFASVTFLRASCTHPHFSLSLYYLSFHLSITLHLFFSLVTLRSRTALAYFCLALVFLARPFGN